MKGEKAQKQGKDLGILTGGVRLVDGQFRSSSQVTFVHDCHHT